MVSRKWAYRELFNSEEAAGMSLDLVVPNLITLPPEKKPTLWECC